MDSHWGLDEMLSSMSSSFAFIDRDGTVIADRNYLSHPDGVELLPNAAAGVSLLAKTGFGLVLVTNQSGIGRGYFTYTDYERVNERMFELLAESGASVDSVLCCPHSPSDSCACRKPSAGLLLDFARQTPVDFASSVVVGDKACDIDLGKAVGC